VKSSSRILILSVLTIHLGLFFFDFTEKKTPPPKISLVVNTYIPPPPPAPKFIPNPKPKKRVKKNSLDMLLAKVESNEKSLKPSKIVLPKLIKKLEIDGKEGSYFDTLASFLKEALELPEVGGVKLELTLLSDGRVHSLKVVESMSENNKKYLQQELIFLGFPPFTNELKKERQHTFVLNFFNEN